MPLIASDQDVADRFEGTLTQEQQAWVSTKILDAEALLFSHFPRLANLPSLTPVEESNARRVICEAVLRVLRNPAGIQHQTTGPFSATRHEDNARGQLFFTDDELGIFREVRRKRVGMLGIAAPRWAER